MKLLAGNFQPPPWPKRSPKVAGNAALTQAQVKRFGRQNEARVTIDENVRGEDWSSSSSPLPIRPTTQI